MGRKKSSGVLEVKFTPDQKHTLEFQVSQEPCLWDLSDKLYKKHDAHTAAWDRVGTAMKASANDCKTAWKSLRDALRYQVRGKEKGKSGDSAPEVDEEDQDDFSEQKIEGMIENWPFWNSMKFLSMNKPQRRTLSTMEISKQSFSDEDIPNESEVLKLISESRDQELLDLTDGLTVSNSTPVPSRNENSLLTSTTGSKRKLTGSNYDYATKKKKLDPLEIGTEKIVSGINKLIDMRKEILSANNSDENLKYLSMYTNLYRMLKKLPEDTVDELNFQFISMIRTEVKKLN